MEVVIVESPAKAKTINKYLGSNYVVLASYGHVRDLPPRDGSVETDNGFAMHWELYADKARQLKAISDEVKKADRVILATDPDREGEAIAWHLLEWMSGEEGPAAQGRRDARDVQRDHQAGDPVGDGQAPRRRRRPRRRLPRPARARLSRRLQPVAGAVAQATRREVGGARPVGRAAHRRRPRARDRDLRQPRILDGRGDAGDRRRRVVRRAADPLERQEARPLRPCRSRRRAAGACRRRGRQVHGVGGRDQARHAQPLPAVHHLDATAGGGAQARLHREPHDARRAVALRGRPHHLYADRRRPGRRRGDRRRRARSSPRTSAAASTSCPRPRATMRPRRRTRRKHTRRSARPTSPGARGTASAATTAASTR